MFRSMMSPTPTPAGANAKGERISQYLYAYDDSGDVRTAGQAMRISAVYRCVDILSGTIASMPLQVLRRRGGIYLLDEGHELASIMLTSVPVATSLDSWWLVINVFSVIGLYHSGCLALVFPVG